MFDLDIPSGNTFQFEILRFVRAVKNLCKLNNSKDQEEFSTYVAMQLVTQLPP